MFDDPELLEIFTKAFGGPTEDIIRPLFKVLLFNDRSWFPNAVIHSQDVENVTNLKKIQTKSWFKILKL